MSEEYPDSIPPLWVVEIVSPTDQPVNVRKKRNIYLQAGILYFEMYPQEKAIDVWTSAQSVQTYQENDTIDLSSVIPGFRLAVKAIFSA
jgi:Uma2 family endonuclease